MLSWQPFWAFYIWSAHWRHLKNTTEPSMCGGDAALCQITLTTCYYCRYAALQYHIDEAYCYRWCSVVCLSICLSKSWALQNGWTDRDAVWDVHSGRPKEARIRYGVHICANWRIRLNRPYAVAMRPYVKLLWSLVVAAWYADRDTSFAVFLSISVLFFNWRLQNCTYVARITDAPKCRTDHSRFIYCPESAATTFCCNFCISQKLLIQTKLLPFLTMNIYNFTITISAVAGINVTSYKW